jgi:hypothetical protein
MSWLWPEFINKDLVIGRQERKAIHRDAWKVWFQNRRNLVFYLVVPAVYLLAAPHASDWGGRIAGLVGVTGWAHKLFRAAGPVFLLLVCFVLEGAVLHRARFAPCVYLAARRRGHDLCGHCGYWLRGLGEDISRCPECGAQRESEEDRQSALSVASSSSTRAKE